MSFSHGSREKLSFVGGAADAQLEGARSVGQGELG
jgi:hypothetical protein